MAVWSLASKNSIDPVIVRSLPLLMTRRFTLPRSMGRPSIPTAGRPPGTSSSPSAKPTSHQPSVRQNWRTTASSTAMSCSLPSSRWLFQTSSPSRPNWLLHWSCASSEATRSTPSNAVFAGTTPFVKRSTTPSQRMSP